MESSNQKPTEENSDFFMCGYCCEDFQGEKHLLLCKCPANNQKCRNGGCIRCLLMQQFISWNVANLQCASCFKHVTKQDINKVLDAAMEAAVDCCLGARCQKRGLDCQTEIECPNKDCFNQLHKECLLSLIKSEESTHISCPLCDKLLKIESSPKKTLDICPVETMLQDEEPIDVTDEFEVPNILGQRVPLCMNEECLLQGSSEELTGCMTPGCDRIFHKYCLLYFSHRDQGCACSECRVPYTLSDWVNYMNSANPNEAFGSDSDMD